MMCWAPLGRDWARCSRLNRCTSNLSWADETSGSQACVLRVVLTCGVARVDGVEQSSSLEFARLPRLSRDAWTLVRPRRRRHDDEKSL